MKIGDQVIYTWANGYLRGDGRESDRAQKPNEAEGKILFFKGKKSALVEFSRGGHRVAQTVRIEKLRLKEEA